MPIDTAGKVGEDMTPGEVIEKLKKKPAEGVYLLVGEEGYLRKQVLEAICGSLFAEATDRNLDVFDGDRLVVEELSVRARTMPFFGEKQLLIVHDVDKLKSAGAEKMAALVGDLPPFSVLVLTASSLDKRGRLWKTVKKQGIIVTCERVRPEQVPKLIAGRVRERGLKIEPEAVKFLAGMFSDLTHLATELEKLLVYVGDQKKITLADVREVVSLSSADVAKYAIFDFVDKLAEGKTAASIKLLQRLLTAGREPVMILGMIARQFRLILRTHGLRAKGANVNDVASALRVPRFVAKKLWQQSRLVTEQKAATALWLCYRADREMKTGGDGRRALELLIVQLQKNALDGRSG